MFREVWISSLEIKVLFLKANRGWCEERFVVRSQFSKGRGNSALYHSFFLLTLNKKNGRWKQREFILKETFSDESLSKSTQARFKASFSPASGAELRRLYQWVIHGGFALTFARQYKSFVLLVNKRLNMTIFISVNFLDVFPSKWQRILSIVYVFFCKLLSLLIKQCNNCYYYYLYFFLSYFHFFFSLFFSLFFLQPI